MPVKEATVLIFDTDSKYEDWNLIDDQLNIIDIETSHEDGLDTIRKTQPNLVAKVINKNENYSFDETLEFLKSAKELSHDTRFLVINVDNEKEKIYQLIDIGVDGVCDGKSTQLLDAIKHMQEYPVYISFSYQNALLEEFRNKPARQARHGVTTLRINYEKAREELSKREIEVLEDLILNAGSSDDRAARLFISPKTYKNHIARIMDKLYADNRTHIVPIAIKKGIIETIIH